MTVRSLEARGARHFWAPTRWFMDFASFPLPLDIAFTEAIKSHRVVVEHFSFEIIRKIFARVEVRQIAAELVAFATLLRASSVGWIF